MKKLCLLAVALAVCGCRQQESRSGTISDVKPAPGSAKTAVTDARPEIACFGDSLTAGFGLETGQSFPDILQQELDQRGYRYRVANFGVNGDTTQDGLERLPLALADKPALVVLELGANDGLRGQPVAVIRENLAKIIEGIQKSGAQLVLAGMTLPPNYGPAYIERFRDLYPEVAAKYKIPLIPFLLAGVGGNDRLMQRDGLHPNAAGTRLVAGTVLKTLEPLLRK